MCVPNFMAIDSVMIETSHSISTSKWRLSFTKADNIQSEQDHVENVNANPSRTKVMQRTTA